jgi:hypothetical protein
MSDVAPRRELARTVGGHRRLLALALGLLVLLAAAILLARSCGGDAPPSDATIRFFPETTLVHVHASTDRERGADERAGELLERFDSYERRRDAILQRLSGGDRPVDVDRDVEPWLGDEAAFGLLNVGTATAGSLIVLSVTDEAQARAFLDRNPRRPVIREYKDEPIAEYGSVAVAFKDKHLLIGQGLSVQAAMDRANERGDSLDETAEYRRATRNRPEGRVVDFYATADGLRRLLIPQGDVIGTLSVLLDQPALQAVSLSAEPADEGVKVTTRSALDRRRSRPMKAFEPGLLEAVPQDALAYLGVNGISGPLTRLIASAAGGTDAGGVGRLLEGLRGQLDRESGGRLQKDLLDLLRQETAIVLASAAPAPILVAVTRVGDEGATRETLRRLQEPLARVLTPRGEQAPRWRAEDFGDGVKGATLATPAGASLSYAVFDGRLVFGTSPDGVRRLRDADGSIEDAEGFDDVVGDRPERVGSLGFLDFSQLLELGEQTGLNDSRAYLAAREDLQKIRAVGVHSTGTEEETTAEILLSIP